VEDLARLLRIYLTKTKFVSPHARPWTRARVQWAFMRRRSYAQWPLYGHVLAALKEGRLDVDTDVTLLAGCWLTLPGDARIRIGKGTWVNGNVMIHAYDLIEIGDYVGIGRGTFITDATHNFDAGREAFIETGMTLLGPTRIGRGVWIGNNTAIMGGVTIGDGALVGANSVVTHDVEGGTMVAGAPARVVKRLRAAPDVRGTGAAEATSAP
jgi:acetyltransferase-like isoleucine patch superfamily enzyme